MANHFSSANLGSNFLSEIKGHLDLDFGTFDWLVKHKGETTTENFLFWSPVLIYYFFVTFQTNQEVVNQ